MTLRFWKNNLYVELQIRKKVGMYAQILRLQPTTIFTFLLPVIYRPKPPSPPSPMMTPYYRLETTLDTYAGSRHLDDLRSAEISNCIYLRSCVTNLRILRFFSVTVNLINYLFITKFD